MVLTLLAVTLISGAVLGFVHKVTKEPIETAAKKAQNEAIEAILPAFDQLSEAKEVMPADGTNPLVFFRASDAEGNLVGTAVRTYSINGFSGLIEVMVGFDTSGVITGYQVLMHKETPGLGSKMQEWFSHADHTIIGINPGEVNMTVSKDGGDIDAITASTISSRAFLESIVRGYNTYIKNANEGGAK
ncbi:MAG: RnfABCDGE type electron transport complex subunit G [Mangrovibacterium sp.]